MPQQETRIMGVDWGKTGACALFDDCSLVAVVDCGDIVTLRNVAIDWRPGILAIERLGPIAGPKFSSKRNYHAGHWHGASLMISKEIGCRWWSVSPATWQAIFHLRGKTKKQHAALAGAIWGHNRFVGPKGGPLHGRADACLIGLCCRMTLAKVRRDHQLPRMLELVSRIEV